MKLLIFGGTTEGRELAAHLAALHVDTTVSVATGLGAEELAGLSDIQVLTGRLDADAMAELLGDFTLCVDATHPYAVEVSANIRAACAAAGVPLRRLLRPASSAEGAVWVPDCPAAARYLADRPGNILLATGAKELNAFSALEKSRLYARVLPTHQGLSACETLGLPHKNILALQGPFSQKLNEAMLEQYHISWLVTKDGGRAGGFWEKLAAAQHTGAQLILIGRPPEQGETMEEILNAIKEMMA